MCDKGNIPNPSWWSLDGGYVGAFCSIFSISLFARKFSHYDIGKNEKVYSLFNSLSVLENLKKVSCANVALALLFGSEPRVGCI